MELRILDKDDALTWVALIGSLDAQGTAEVKAEFIAHTASRQRPTVVDLSGVTFIMSRGLTMLMHAAKLLREADAKLVLLNPSDQVRGVLYNVSLDKVIPIVGDEAQARRLLQ
jgi:anti-anti-sigma factor